MDNNDYDVGYFEGIRAVVLRRMQYMEQEDAFMEWLSDELKEALRIRDDK